MKEQQRFLFSRQSLCFLVGEKETMKLMIHFWADSLDSLIVHKSWANFILATSAEVTKWWLKTSQLQKLVDGQSTNLSSYNSSHEQQRPIVQDLYICFSEGSYLVGEHCSLNIDISP